MRKLSFRLVREHLADLVKACQDFIRNEGWEAEDIDGLCQRIIQQGLLKIGQIRAVRTALLTNVLVISTL